jgi:transketolase
MTYEETLWTLAESHPELVVLTAENRAAIRNLPARLGDRFVDVGICEQTMVGMAAGLALRGRRPIVHALAAFLTMRAFEFIRTDVGVAGLPVIFVGGVPGFLSEANGPTHQAVEDIALMRAVPGMQIVCPADVHELVAALPAVLRSGRPTYIRYHAGPPLGRREYALGRADVVGAGTDVALVTYGLLVAEALAARANLAAHGIDARVVNLRSLEPIDEAAILDATAARLVVTLEDHFVRGGLHSIVAELLLARGRAARVVPLALPGRWFRPALLPAVLEHEQFTARHIAARVKEAYEAPRHS